MIKLAEIVAHAEEELRTSQRARIRERVGT
jgi:hypothetical protein